MVHPQSAVTNFAAKPFAGRATAREPICDHFRLMGQLDPVALRASRLIAPVA